RVVELLREVGIPEPAYRARNYAFQLSGGMAQRVLIAAALGGNPDVLIADEPTTALDVTIQLQILKLIDRERRERGLAVLLITHDLSVVAALADRVAVMYAGRIVEQGATAHILRGPRHPYTQVLVESSLLRERSAGRSDPWRESAEDAATTRGARRLRESRSSPGAGAGSPRSKRTRTAAPRGAGRSPRMTGESHDRREAPGTG
ncbi:MAG: ABC transporter ATP-binding protein, partial [Acidobacteria bacterium]|nr:ABC transporter ATP-binding protein [Acidobacteriota bacterium]